MSYLSLSPIISLQTIQFMYMVLKQEIWTYPQ